MRQKQRSLVLIKTSALIGCLIIAALGFTSFLSNADHAEASATGPSPSHTNAPMEDNCTACHSDFAVNSGSGSVRVTGIPPVYKPNEPIQITVTTSQQSAVVYGFQLTSIDKDGRQAGTFAVPRAFPMRTQIVTGSVGGNERKYVEHTVDGVIPPGFDSNSWTFTWTPPSRRVGKIGFFVAGNAANSDGNTTGDYIYTSSASASSGAVLSNFDADAKSDISIWRPSSGTWYTINSGSNSFQVVPWGAAGDEIVPGDYDGDGKSDIAVWRPSNGNWYIQESTGGFLVAEFGTSGDIPVTGDYDGDLKSDIAVWRPSTGQWFVLRSSDSNMDISSWGTTGDRPVPGDYDADGKTDLAVYRPSSGIWYVFRSSDGSYGVVQWGDANDKLVPADYDGDGQIDIAVYRPTGGVWYILKSSDGSGNAIEWGASTDIPVPGDFDGDGLSDIAVYRAGIWYIINSSNNEFGQINWGDGSDIPTPAGLLQ